MSRQLTHWGEPRTGEYWEWVRSAWTRLRRFTTGGSYINLQTADDDQTRVDSYGKNYERLQRDKAEYDPGNLFRVNRNIPPA